MKAIVRLGLLVAMLTFGPALSASMPMRIALMVDTSAATSSSITLIREGVVAFLDALPPEHEVLLVSTGRRTQVRVPPTTDRKKLKDSARGLSNDNGPTPLIDGLLEIDGRFLRKATGQWCVFVVITGDGSESSTGTDEQAFNRWLTEVAKRGVSASAIVLKASGTGLPELVASTLVKATGGHYNVMSNGSGLPDAMKQLANELAYDAERKTAN
ncbi:MAG TPA: VWA domain-containing protein [Vicinamibacterales bacterium]|jgi:hypothetical protein